MQKFRKKPVEVHAFKWTGLNPFELGVWHASLGRTERFHVNDDKTLTIPTLEGDVRCNVGGYVIRGVAGEYYPNNDLEFFQTNNTQIGENLYVKKPVEVEALQILPDNWQELARCFGLKPCRDFWRDREAFCDHAIEGTGVIWYTGHQSIVSAQIKIKGGSLTGEVSDWAIMDMNGSNIRFCKPDIFRATYEAID